MSDLFWRKSVLRLHPQSLCRVDCTQRAGLCQNGRALLQLQIKKSSLAQTMRTEPSPSRINDDITYWGLATAGVDVMAMGRIGGTVS